MRDNFTVMHYLLFTCVTLCVMLLCVCLGSVRVPVYKTLSSIWSAILGNGNAENHTVSAIIVTVRLPRVLSAAFIGAALSLCGAAMQGLLRNPLADGSTLGVSSGASLGAVLSIALGISIPALPFAGTVFMAMLFAFLSMVFIFSLSLRLDNTLATNTIILMGVVFSMFASSIISFITAFSGEKLRSITFWTMGSLANSTYQNVLVLLFSVSVFGGVLLRYARELNAFALGEDVARHIGVNVRRVKLVIMAAVSCLIGVCVASGGSIGFVGLIMPHIVRMLTGPNHRKLLPACIFAGAVFLMLADLLARTVLSPAEIPIGVITSLVGCVLFVWLFYRTRKAKT